MKGITIEKTADGSPTLFREDIDEHYHSVKGALTESEHIYLDLGWRYAAEELDVVTVFEVGFGTGLNAAVTALAASSQKKRTIYYSVELYPLDKEISSQLIDSLPAQYHESFKAVNAAMWGAAVEINPFFTLVKIADNLLTMDIPGNPDVVYFDAFAPEKQPEMWSATLFKKIYDAMKQGGVLTTYCAKGAIRRMLNEIGFTTERLPGPRNGKREVLRAIKERAIEGI